MKKYISFALLGGMVFCVWFSKEIIYAIRESIELCIYTLIPSLFPFLVFSKMMIMSGSARYTGKMIYPLTKRLFGLSENGSFLFLAGIICGYPVGAKCISDMTKDRKITLEEARRLILFCNNSGPLFVIGAIGYGMFSDTRYGVILYISHIMSSLVTGLVTKKPSVSIGAADKTTQTSFFTKSIEDAITTVIHISAYVMFFSSVCAIINSSLPDKINYIKKIIIAISEITGGIKMISSTYSLSLQAKLIITSFLISFGGICVLFQTKSVISGSGLEIVPYIVSKIIQGALSVLFVMMILSFVPVRSCAHIQGKNNLLSTFMLCVSCMMIVIYFFILSKKSNNHKKAEYK